jgi:tetratricopeptide (TPR) repeat protein
MKESAPSGDPRGGVNAQHDIMTVCLAVVRGRISPDQARAAILARTSPAPLRETLRLDAALVREAEQPALLPEKDRQDCLDLFRELYDSTPGEKVLEEDAAFARMLIAQGIVSAPQVDLCSGIQQRLLQAGCAPLPRLGELLIRKGYLLAGQADLAPTRRVAGPESAPVDRPPPPAGRPVPAGVQEALSNSEERFGRYARVSLLGEGGAGEVWKSWDTILERWVALKFLKFENTEELARLRREAQTAARLSHPNIAAVFEMGEANGRTFLVMEFIDGQSLATFSRNDHRKLVSMMRDVSLAIQYAHDKGVIHRDIKPGNIMVDSSGRPFIMDFGLARQIDSERSLGEYILGTPSYMSPEQAKGGAVDARSDVYSLGATLYELLSDRPPFRGQNALDTLEQVVREEPRPLDQIAADLRTIVSKCLMKEPARRYLRAADVAEDIRRWQEGEAIIAHPPSVVYRLGKKIAKRRAVLTVGLCGILLASTVAGWAIPRWLRADREHAQSAQELAVEKESRAEETRALGLARPYLEEGRRTRSRLDRLLMTEDASPESVRSLTEKAHKEFDRALEFYPKHPDALLEKAKAYMAQGDPTRALEYFTKTIEASSGYTTAYLSRARILLDQYEAQRHGIGGWGAAETPEMKALGARIRSDLKEVDARSKDTQELSFGSGALAVVEGDYEKAARIFEEYSREGVSGYRGWEWAGHSWLHVPGMCGKAIRDFTEALKYRPRLALLWVFRGKAYLESARDQGMKGAGARSQAAAEFRHALELEPSNIEALLSLADVLLLTGDTVQAMSTLLRAVELHPKSSTARVSRAWALRRIRETEAALADAEEALRLGSQDPAALAARGFARCVSGDVGGAQADFEEALRRSPKYAPAFVGLGDVLRERGNSAAALVEYGKALLLDPRLAEAYQSRGNAERDLGHLENALSDLAKALALDPTDSYILLDLGVCYCNQGAWDRAQAEFRKGLALRPSREEWFWQRLWLARAKGGESAQARDELFRFIQGRTGAGAGAGKLAPKISDFLAGKTSEEEFLALLERTEYSRKAIAEGYFFAGEKALVEGRTARAMELLKRCLRTGARTSSGYSTAECDLRPISGSR